MKKNFRKIKTPGDSTFKSVLQLGHFALTRPGFNHLRKKLFRKLKQNNSVSYNDWFWAQADISILRNEYEKNIHLLAAKPKISVICVVDDKTANLVNASLQSVMEQLYPYWELCMVYNETGKKAANAVNKIQNDRRIKIIPTTSAGLFALLNTGVAASLHDHILFLEPGSILSPNCLYRFALHIDRHKTDQVVYADEDHINTAGSFYMPWFKPCWSPDTFLSGNYIGSPVLISKTFWNNLKGCREGYEGNEIYDFLLRATDAPVAIGHIPRILCHKQPPYKQTQATAQKAIADTLARRQMPGTVVPIDGAPGRFTINYETTCTEKVSIIIPTKDQDQLLKTTLDSIFEKTSYPHLEVIVISNNSTSPRLFELVADYEQRYGARFKCITANFPFNFSKLINLGVQHSTGTYLLMLNNDVEVIGENWLTIMISYVQHKHIGAVGAKLLYPDDTIQHAGISLGGAEGSMHIFANRDRNDLAYPYYITTVNNYMAVTGACLACRKDVYLAAGGMDEQLPVEYNDIDLCLNFLSRGYYNVYLPMAELYHYESATRGHPFRSKKAWKQHEKDLAAFKGKWGKKAEHDPFFNPLSSVTFLQ